MGVRRIVGNVKQWRAVLVLAKHIQRDETRAGVIALVAENAIQFQRMTNGFVDLQHHLFRHQQQIHFSTRAIGCKQELKRVFSQSFAAAQKSRA